MNGLICPHNSSTFNCTLRNMGIIFTYKLSPMITNSRQQDATIFSCVRQPPPPLIRFKSSSTSSAPSIPISIYKITQTVHSFIHRSLIINITNQNACTYKHKQTQLFYGHFHILHVVLILLMVSCETTKIGEMALPDVLHALDKILHYTNFDEFLQQLSIIRPHTNWRSTVNKDLLRMGITWEEGKVVAQNRSEWRRSVAQCIHWDAGWIKVKIKLNSQVSALTTAYKLHLTAMYNINSNILKSVQKCITTGLHSKSPRTRPLFRINCRAWNNKIRIKSSQVAFNKQVTIAPE